MDACTQMHMLCFMGMGSRILDGNGSDKITEGKLTTQMSLEPKLRRVLTVITCMFASLDTVHISRLASMAAVTTDARHCQVHLN